MTNVVRLPTAAPRQVKNGRWKEAREASRALKAETADRFQYQFPTVRDAMKDAEAFLDIEQTPALLLVSALLCTVDADTRTRIAEIIAPGAAAGRKAHLQAVTTLKLSGSRTVGETHDFYTALNLALLKREY